MRELETVWLSALITWLRFFSALYAVGTPILQSASSTILGVSFLASTESYVFSSFFKTIILVIMLGVLHGLVILPILLILFSKDQTEGDPTESTTKEILPSNFFNNLTPAFTPYHLQPYLFKPYGNGRRIYCGVDSPIHHHPIYYQASLNTQKLPSSLLSSYGLPSSPFQTLPYFSSNSMSFATETPNSTEYFVPVQTIMVKSASPGMAHWSG